MGGGVVPAGEVSRGPGTYLSVAPVTLLHVPLHVRSTRVFETSKHESLVHLVPHPSHAGSLPPPPLRGSPLHSFGEENGLRGPGGCSALPKQTFQQTNN